MFVKLLVLTLSGWLAVAQVPQPELLLEKLGQPMTSAQIFASSRRAVFKLNSKVNSGQGIAGHGSAFVVDPNGLS